MIHQILEFKLHADLYLLYFFALPVFIGIFTSGSFKRIFHYRPAIYWTAFGLCLIPASAFSIWPGGSFALLGGYLRTEFIMLFAIACLVATWQECRLLLYVIASAAVVNIASIIFFSGIDENGRTILLFGTISNSNDYPAHLIFVLPFLLWCVLVTRYRLLRIAGFLAIGLGLYEILASASRGALLGLLAALVVFLATTTAKLRRIILVAIPVLSVIVITLLPATVRDRIFSFSDSGAQNSSEARESAIAREQLLRESIRFTLERPLFGVGTGQFSVAEGSQVRGNQVGAERSLWQGTHNSFTQIASENGIPALLCYIAGIVSSLLLLNKVARFCRRKPEFREISIAVLCLRLSLIGFCAAIFFLNFGYFFYLPAIAGIVIALASATTKLAAVQNPAVNEKRQSLSTESSWSSVGETSAPAGD